MKHNIKPNTNFEKNSTNQTEVGKIDYEELIKQHEENEASYYEELNQHKLKQEENYHNELYETQRKEEEKYYNDLSELNTENL